MYDAHTSIPGEAEIGCNATVEGHLMCTFPENVNITETDFGVYFYPVHGGEGNSWNSIYYAFLLLENWNAWLIKP